MKQINIYGIILCEQGIVKRKDSLYSCPMLEENTSLEECLKENIKKELDIDISILGYLGKVETTKTCDHFYSCKTSEKDKIKYILDYENLFDIDINYKEYIYKAIKGKYT